MIPIFIAALSALILFTVLMSTVYLHSSEGGPTFATLGQYKAYITATVVTLIGVLTIIILTAFI